jgi:hypothetical protein
MPDKAPEVMSVAKCLLRRLFMLAVEVHVPVTGSYISALEFERQASS